MAVDDQVEALEHLGVLADDHRIVRSGLRALLSYESDFEVVAEATNGLEALELVLRTRPDILVLDLMMPEPDGFKLCRMLRGTARFVTAPILIVTALDDTDSRIVAFGAGANDYLVKPYHIEDLTSKLSALLSA